MDAAGVLGRSFICKYPEILESLNWKYQHLDQPSVYEKRPS